MKDILIYITPPILFSIVILMIRAKRDKSAKTIYVKNDKELQKVVKDWQDDKIEILSFSHNLVDGGYEVIVKPISKN